MEVPAQLAIPCNAFLVTACQRVLRETPVQKNWRALQSGLREQTTFLSEEMRHIILLTCLLVVQQAAPQCIGTRFSDVGGSCLSRFFTHVSFQL